jgi:hypothetical protein
MTEGSPEPPVAPERDATAKRAAATERIPQPACDTAAEATPAPARYGPLLVAHTRKADGRALILYRLAAGADG